MTSSTRARANSARSVFSNLDRIEVLVLASGLFVLIPGARTLWAWPWLWFVPGWFFVRRVLGVRSGFLLVVLSLVTSIAFASLACLPLTVLFGGPRPWVVLVSITLFAFTCTLAPRKGGRALPSVPWPPGPAAVLVGAFVALRIVVAIRESTRIPIGPDAWYLAGIVRELAAGYPPQNPIAAMTVLKQPWGYWLLYSLTHVTSRLSVAATLHVASVILAVAFLSSLYLIVTTVSGDRRAGGFGAMLALGASEILWIEDALRPTTERITWDAMGMTSFAANLVYAFYDVPVLILAIAVIYFVAVRRPELAWILAAVAPFFHPVHAAVLFVALALGLGFEAAKRRLAPAHAWLLTTPIPFVILFVVAYAGGLPPHPPFSPRLSEIGERLVRFVRWAGMFVPLAIAGALRRELRVRSVLVMLFVTTSALSVLTFAANYHWPTDLLFVSMAMLGGVALGAIAERHGRLGRALASSVVVTAIVAADYPKLLAPAEDRRTSEERAAGRWIKASTAPRAVFSVDPKSMPAIATALALGERRVLCGPSYQLINTATQAEVDALFATASATLHEPCSARAYGVDYVLLEHRPKDADALALWRAAGALVYENGAMSVFATDAVRGCPDGAPPSR